MVDRQFTIEAALLVLLIALDDAFNEELDDELEVESILERLLELTTIGEAVVDIELLDPPPHAVNVVIAIHSRKKLEALIFRLNIMFICHHSSNKIKTT